MEIEKPHIDQNALSRQLAVYGHEAQGKLMAMRVFIYGVTGVRIILVSWELKSPRTSSSQDPSRSRSTTPPSSPQPTSAATSTSVESTSERFRAQRHHSRNCETSTPTSTSTSPLKPQSSTCKSEVTQRRPLRVRSCHRLLRPRVPRDAQQGRPRQGERVHPRG